MGEAALGKVRARAFEEHDPVTSPAHYRADPSGVEAITVTQHRTFCVGNAIKYLWRAGLKTEEGKSGREKTIEDLRKAAWYVNQEIKRLEGEQHASR